MLQPSMEYTQRILVENEEKELSKTRRKKILKKMGKRALITLAVLSVPVAGYTGDVLANQAAQSEAISTIQVSEAPLDPENNDKAIVFFDGFRSNNADELVLYRGEGLQNVLDGQLWSVGYNNANLQPNTIGENIISLADEQGVDTLYFYGESAGGTIEMEAQAYVAEHSDITIAAHILNSVPDGAAGLRKARQDEIKTVETLSVIPGAKYSSVVRFLGEMAFRSESFYKDGEFNIDKAFSTTGEVIDVLQGDKVAGSWLMFDQLMAIEDADIQGHINKIGELPPEIQRPVVIYIGTAKPGFDYIVNDKLSAENIEQYALDANVPFIHLRVPGAVHSLPGVKVESFNTTLADAKNEIQKTIATEENIAAFNKRESRRDGKVFDSLPIISDETEDTTEEVAQK